MALTGRADGPALLPPGAAATSARRAEIDFRALQSDPGPVLGWHHLLAERAAISGTHHRQAPWSVGGATRAVRAADGWIAVTLARPDDVVAIGALVEGFVPASAADAWRQVDAWAPAHPSAVIAERAALLGIPLGPIPPAGTWARRPGDEAIRTHEILAGAVPDGPPLVVDFSSLWAGPLCAQLLGTAGARVVKVETPQRLDGARTGLPGLYDVLHAGHESVLLDPVADRSVLLALVEQADIVIEASRPRSLANLGLGAVETCRQSPTTWVSITAWGRDHPDHVGFGDDVAMSAGLVVWEDGVPFPVGDAIADPLTGMYGAVAALASYRRGGSRILDVAMRDVVAAASSWSDPEQAPDPGSVVAQPPRLVRAATGTAVEPGRDTERIRYTL